MLHALRANGILFSHCGGRLVQRGRWATHREACAIVPFVRLTRFSPSRRRMAAILRNNRPLIIVRTKWADFFPGECPCAFSRGPVSAVDSRKLTRDPSRESPRGRTAKCFRQRRTASRKQMDYWTAFIWRRPLRNNNSHSVGHWWPSIPARESETLRVDARLGSGLRFSFHSNIGRPPPRSKPTRLAGLL